MSRFLRFTVYVTQRPILRFFAQQWRHVALLGVKFLHGGVAWRSTTPCQTSPPSV